MKKPITLLLAAAILIGMFCVPFTAHAEETAEDFGIDKAFLIADAPISVSNPEGYTLRFYIDDAQVGEGGYIPQASDYEKWITVKAYDGDEFVCEDRAYFSKLPVLYINTDDGESVTSKEEYKSGSMLVQNNAASSSVYSGAISIKGRGNSSWGWPKKPYRIKLDKKADLFGMGTSKHWVLLANYLDESLMRNTTGFRLSEQLGLNAMSTVWTDVVFNGEYAGNYQLCEQIRIDEGRVDIFDWEGEAKNVASAVAKKEKKLGNIIDKDALEDALTRDLAWITTGSFDFNDKHYIVSEYYELDGDISGGYLFELSNEYDEISRFKTNNQLYVMLKSPEYLLTNTAMLNYVKTYWQSFENAFRSEDGYANTADGRKHYTELADLDSMVAYWLTMEIMGNNDAYYKSRFVSLDKGGLLTFGPVWDFDWGCGSLTVGTSATGWKVTTNTNLQAFYKDLVDDPLFIVKATEKYWQIRPYLAELIASDGILNEYTRYLRESGLADQARWNRKDTWLFAARGFEWDASLFKTYMKNRINWLDKQFASDSALIASAYTELSAYPYTKDEDALDVTFYSALHDPDEAHAPADAVYRTGRTVVASIGVDDEATASVDIYLNGLYCYSAQVEDGTASLRITSDSLSAELGSKNVISMIGRSSSGETTVKNFVTVKQKEIEGDILLGDADRDGFVNIIDVTCIQRYLAGYDVSNFCYEAADIRGVGLSILDATAIQRYLVDLPAYEGIGELI